MQLKEEITGTHNGAHAKKIAAYIGSDKVKFKELMELFINGAYRINQRSASILVHCVEENPDLVKPYIKSLFLNLKKNPSNSLLRNSLRILQWIEIPKAVSGLAAELCFQYLASPKTPVAVRVFAMTIIFNISKKEPELKNELKIIIEDNLPYASPGFVSRGQKILKALRGDLRFKRKEERQKKRG